MSLVKIYGDFYSSNNVAGVLRSKVITFDNPQLSTIQGDPAFSSFDEMCLPFSELYCDFCHSKLKGNLCYSCGASYEKEPALNG